MTVDMANSPTPLPSPPPKDSSRGRKAPLSASDQKFLGLMQQVTRTGNDWRPYLAGLTPTSPAAIAACEKAYQSLRPQIDDYLKQARETIAADTTGSLRRWWGDVETHISNQWRFVDQSYAGVAAGGDVAAVAMDCLERVDEAGFTAARITIPPRLRDILSTMAVGDSIAFDSYFSDEVPSEQLRSSLLEEWVNHTALLDACIDSDKRTIVKVSASVASQWLAVIVAVVLAAACVGALVALRRWGASPGLPEESKRPDVGVVVTDAALVWFGMITHIALSGYKRLQAVPQSARRVLSLISARQFSLWIGVVIGAVLAYVFALSGRVTEPAAIFAVGYSSDSIVAQLLPQFDSGMAKLAKALPVPAVS